MSTDTKEKGTEIATISKEKQMAAIGVGDQSQGGLGGEDFEIPRVQILQKTSPDIGKAENLVFGAVVNSITKEDLGKLFIPLFAFKQYAEFKSDGSLVFSSIDRTDPRVIDGLKWGTSGDAEKDKPVMTEFINFMAMFEGEQMPLVLSFKRTSIGVAKKLLTLMSLKPKLIHCYRYMLETEHQQNGNNEWYVPRITAPEKKIHCLKDAEIEEYTQMASSYRALISKVKVQDESATDETSF